VYEASPIVPLNITQMHPLSEKNVKSFGQFMEERASRSRQGSIQGAESHYSGVTVQTMASIQEELAQTKETLIDLAQSVKSLVEEMKQLKTSSRNA
jgi:methyl-accepting chemotaxis protein